jgi:hypothetical protein
MRVRPSGLLVGLLIATVIAAVGLLGLLADLANLRSEHAAEYRAGERGLHSLVLPPSIAAGTDAATDSVRSACRPAPDTRCLHTVALPNVVAPLLGDLIMVTHDTCPSWSGGTDCQAMGHIAGQPAVVVVVPHLYVTKSGFVPAGAVPGPRGDTYYRGSDIVLELIKP